MIFSTGLKKIYESIEKQPAEKQEKLLNSLHEKISANKALTHKFELLDKIQEHKGGLSKVQAKKFMKKLKEKHENFLSENNEVAIFYREEKKLFEYFNINQKEVVSEKLDLIVNKKDNKLNESLILEYVTNPNIVTLQESMARYKPDIKESFASIKVGNDVEALDNALEFISFKSNMLEGERKKMVRASVDSIFEESFSNFGSAVEKAYKLDMLAEKFLKEYSAEDEDEDFESVDDFGPADDDFRGKTYTDKGFNFVQKIECEVPKGTGSDFVSFKFVIPIYPNEAYMADITVELNRLLRRPLRYLSRYFKQAVLRAGKGLFTTNDMKFDVKMRTELLKPGQVVNAKFQVFMSVNEEVNLRDFPVDSKNRKDFAGHYWAAAYAVLQAFNNSLPSNTDIAPYLTDENMKLALAASTGKRKNSYTQRDGEDKYYTDKRSVSDDSWMDQALITGDTRAEHGEEPIVDDYSDIDSGKGILPGGVESDDDIADREATQAAMQRKKPGLVKKAA